MKRRMRKSRYPSWICVDCGHQHAVRPINGIATFHVGDPCGWCERKDVPVTEPRDYGYPKYLGTSS